MIYKLVSAIFIVGAVSTQAYGQSLSTCQLAGSDPDGDGFGWENGASCRVAQISGPAPSGGGIPLCESAASDFDGDGFGWENNQSCVVPASGNNGGGSTGGENFCSSADSDPDGDGYGWENNQSCVVATDSGNSSNGSGSGASGFCISAESDPDGDGFGWENNQSCVVRIDSGNNGPDNGGNNAGNNTGGNTPTVCVSALSDPDGDGFGWENNQSCVVTADTGNNNTGSNGGTTPEQDFRTISPAGVLASGTPTFQWTALDDTEMYTLAIADSAGNGYAYEIDPLRAGCQGGGTCSATPDLAYYDNDLTWRVKTTVNGSDGPETDRVSITTPQNINVQPVKSGECEAWPSVAYDKYIVLNNTWNSRAMNNSNWSQKIFVSEDNFGNVTPTWSYDWLGQFDGGEIDVKAYPEVLYGPKLGTHVSGSKEETGLPELVSDLPEFVVEYGYTETGNAERNVALESFFHDSCDIAGPCDPVDNRAFEMMIWVENPSIRTPGRLTQTGVMIDNRLWNVYTKPDSDPHYIAFTAQDSQSSGTLNWNRFVDWTVDWTAENSESLGIDVLSPNFCMGAIELGTEMWWGEGSFTLNKFDVTFQR